MKGGNKWLLNVFPWKGVNSQHGLLYLKKKETVFAYKTCLICNPSCQKSTCHREYETEAFTADSASSCTSAFQPLPALPPCRGRHSAAAWICHMASPPDLSFSYGQITSSLWQFAWIKGLANEVEPGDIVWKSAVASVRNCSVKQLSARWRGAQAFLTGWKPSSLEFPLQHKDFTMQSIFGHKCVQYLESVLVFTEGCGFSLTADSNH